MDWFLLYSGFLPEVKKSAGYLVLLTEILNILSPRKEALLEAFAFFLNLWMLISEGSVEDLLEVVF